VLITSEQWTNTPHNNVFVAMSYSIYLQGGSNRRVMKICNGETMTIKGNEQ